MRVTSIELAGTSKTTLRDGTPGLPRAFAKITRTTDADSIEVTILRSGGENKRMVRADCAEDIRSMAECLQHHLDGCKGTHSMVHEYVAILQYFAD